MTMFLQLHILTAYAAANLNRDDTGRPKTLRFGGAERLRVSSQSLKRAFRTSDVFANALPGALGTRSQRFMQSLIDALVARGLDAEAATARAEAVIEHDRLGKVKDKGKGSAKTEQLVHLGPDELETLENLADRLAASDSLDDKAMLVLKDKPRAADIAMFGRMLADNSGFNVEAAVQVAHAFTTHRATVEDDYYTAVDDIKNADGDADRGAGFIGEQSFGAGLFYLYICIDADLLTANLAGDKALACTAIEALIRAAATVSPSGKQNTYASRGRASYMMLETGAETPRSLAAAFQKPVTDSDPFADSLTRLNQLRDGFARVYGETPQATVMNAFDPDSATLADIVKVARAACGYLQ